MDPSIKELIEEFAEKIQEHVQQAVNENIQKALSLLGSGLPTSQVAFDTPKPGKKARKYTPQLCPVPGCKNRAAPRLGMVCGEHKNIAKSTIRKYREARKSTKEGGTAPTGTKRRGRPPGSKNKVKATPVAARTVVAKVPAKTAAPAKAKKTSKKAAGKTTKTATKPAAKPETIIIGDTPRVAGSSPRVDIIKKVHKGNDAEKVEDAESPA